MLLESWDLMRARKESKRVIILITDGDPDDKGLANRAGASIKADGGIVIGISVKSGKPRFDLDNWVMVPEIEELPEKMIAVIRTII